jgi:hypothetical protein
MCSSLHRKPYPSDVSDEEWSLVVSYLTLMTLNSSRRECFPPWAAVYQQSQRWLASGCFETLAQDLRAVLRLAGGRARDPREAIIDSRTLHSRRKAALAPAMTAPSASVA